jgi:tRNA (mo5U34)-methyltransferase
MTTPHSSAVRLNNLGVRNHAEGKFHESNAAHKECSAILDAGGPETALLLARSLANRAALYRTFQEYHEAERLFQMAIRIGDRYGSSGRADDEMSSAEVVEDNGLLRSFGYEVDRLRESNDPDALRLAISRLGPWYHDVELTPGVSTNPANKQYMANRWGFLKPFVPDDLTGKSVLDIGCNAGFFSFEMKKRNAARVVGVDTMLHVLAQARFLSHWFKQPIELRELSVYDIESLGQFDFVVFIGVLYHLRHPLYALDKVASICRDTTYLQSLLRGDARDFEPAANYAFDEKAIFERPEFPRMYFIEKSFNGDESNWWVPNHSCLKAMARAAGFRKIENSGHPELIVCRKFGV